MASTLGTVNPFRYRAYYYDTETGYYYLQSRYYNPEIGRFLNADGYISTGEEILGNNMFEYCYNNPIKYIDSFGMEPFTIASLVVLLSQFFTYIMGTALLAFLTVTINNFVNSSDEQSHNEIELLRTNVITTISIAIMNLILLRDTIDIAISIPKINIETETNLKNNDIIFPLNPYDFNPIGLERVEHTGTKNGKIISWMNPVTNTEVFRWDANVMYDNGPHYHVQNSLLHYYAFDKIPEPYASIYFPVS